MTIDLKNLKADLSNIKKTIQFVYNSDKRLFIVRLFLIVIQSLLPLYLLLLTKQLIDVITNSGSRSSENIWFTIAIFCGVTLVIQITAVLNTIVGEILGQKIVNYVNNILHNKSLELDLTYYDNPEYYDTFHRAQQEATFRPIQILLSISELMTNIISFVGVAIILATLSGYVFLVIILAGIPSLYIKLVRTKVFYEWKTANTNLYREVGYHSMLMTQRIYAKEMRIFTLGNYILKAHNFIRDKLMHQVIQLSKKTAKGNIVSAIFEVSALAISIVILTNKILVGEVSIGSFVMFFGALRGANQYISGIMNNVTGIYNNKLFLSNLFAFINLKPHIKQIENAYMVPKLTKGLKFENVSFTYEGGKRKILNNVSFEIKPGETVLITGKNGAGKTTLINVLCRMYERSSGSITLDGIDIKDMDIDSLHKNIGIICQDYCKYNLTVSDNIKFGDVDAEHDIKSAAVLSGADEFIEDLPKKYNTIVGKFFEDGEELSIGQWQKIALARAFYNDAQIIILDEPTSSIDMEAENKFFEKLNNLKKDKIVIIIGHKITHKISADSYFTLKNGELKKVNRELVNA
ncbi:MAG TPA: ABC transporter ATP-binding protein [Ignavibacteria bacterium]|nr:ABC transporter ATP-binding protein [Ignavibacteria bacterium]